MMGKIQTNVFKLRRVVQHEWQIRAMERQSQHLDLRPHPTHPDVSIHGRSREIQQLLRIAYRNQSRSLHLAVFVLEVVGEHSCLDSRIHGQIPRTS